MQFQDYYKILGVKRNAGSDEITKAYRKLARKYHPDVSKEEKAEDRFKEVSEAYEVLKNPETRKRYDALGANWKAGQEFKPPPGWEHIFSGANAGFGGTASGPGGASFSFDLEGGRSGGPGGFSDFFEAVFGGLGGAAGATQSGFSGNSGYARGQRQPQGQRGQNLETSIEISIYEAFNGDKKNISFNIVDNSGVSISPPKRKSYQVTIPAGTTDGTIIRLAGQGSAGSNNMPAGDLLLKVKVLPDSRFRLDGSDIIMQVPITPWEAALGAKIKIATLDSQIALTIPPGSQNNQRLRLKDKGFPKKRGGKGDLIASLSIVLPKTLNQKEKALFEELSKESHFNPRN